MANYNIAVPVGKVEIAVAQIGSYIPSDPSQDFHAAHFADSLGKEEMTNLMYDKEMEAIRRPMKTVKRNNYIYSPNTAYTDFKLYQDSDPILETRRRLWEPFPTLDQENSPAENPAFIAPKIGKAYPVQYNGPRWSLSSFNESTKDTNGIQALIEMPSTGSVPSLTAETTAKEGQVFWVNQSTVGNCHWGIKQRVANFKNQPFNLHIKKAKTTSAVQLNALNPASRYGAHPGNHLAIFLGGGIKSHGGKPFETPSPSPSGELPPLPGSTSTDISALTAEDFQSFAFVFPIGEQPYVLWTKAWGEYLNGKFVNGFADISNDPMAPFKLFINEDPSWILPDDMAEFSLTFFPFNGKIFIRSSYCETPWVFANESSSLYKTMFKMLTGKELSPQYVIPEVRAEIPNIPLEIQGRGFKCALNMTPAEFFYPGDNEDAGEAPTDTPAAGAAFLKLPFMTYSKGINGSGGQTITTWGNEINSPNAFILPGNDQNNKAFPKFGYDFDPRTQTTTHGLPANCLSVVVLEDYVSTENPDNMFNVPGAQVALTANNPLAPYTNFIRYGIIFNDVPSINQSLIGSKAYCTPLFFRIKFKGRINKTAPNASDWIDITNHVQQIGYSAKYEESCFKKEVNLSLIMPKQSRDTNLAGYAIPNKVFWASLQRKHFLVRIFLGHDPDNENVPELLKTDFEQPFFTGVAWGGDMNYKVEKDSFNIAAVDLTEVLNDIGTLNSPWYDGMDLKYAIATVLERSGFSALSGIEAGQESDNTLLSFSISDRAIPLSNGWVLPDSLAFTQPLLKFPPGTKSLEIIKGFANRFWLIFKATREGGFQLDCWAGSSTANTYGDPSNSKFNNIRYQPTNSLIPGQGNEFNAAPQFYTYRSIPQINNGGFAASSDNNYLYFLLKDTKIIRMKPSKWNNMYGISTINRITGGIEILTQGDPESIANPAAPNFIGFMKAGFSLQAGYGGKDNARQSLNLITNILFKPIMIVNAQIWGNRLLEPLDIIRIDSNNYRIISIDAEATTDGTPSFTMNITAENINDSSPEGQWITTEDINIFE